MPNLPRSNGGSFAAYTEPGGHPVYYVCNDGGWIFFACAACAIRVEDGFYDVRVVKAVINWGDDDLCCDYCAKPIECVYT